MSVRVNSYRSSVFLPESYEQEAEVAWNQFASKTTCSQVGVPSIIVTDPDQREEKGTSHRYQSYNELLDRSNKNIDDLFQDVICQFEHISEVVDTIISDIDKDTMDLFNNAIENIQCCIEEVEQCCPLRY